MTGLHAWIERMWWKASPPPWPLRVLEPVYGMFSRRHLERRAQQVTQPPLPLISVGNITAGGSGKTPFVIWLAEQLIKTGRKPVILCRGDSGKSSSDPVRVNFDADPSLVGDEALLLAKQSGCAVISGRDRIKGSKLAATLGDTIILDDGFQYRGLGRICDIVLVPSEGVGNGHQIPAGPLREPVSALDRADLIVRSGSSQFKPLTKAKEWHWQALPGALQDVMQTGETLPLHICAATGIARPERFLNDLRATGREIQTSRRFPDHHRFTSSDVQALLDLELPIVVTAKDAVKLSKLWPSDQPLWVLPQSGIGEKGLFDAIKDTLKTRVTLWA